MKKKTVAEPCQHAKRGSVAPISCSDTAKIQICVSMRCPPELISNTSGA